MVLAMYKNNFVRIKEGSFAPIPLLTINCGYTALLATQEMHTTSFIVVDSHPCPSSNFKLPLYDLAPYIFTHSIFIAPH